LSWLSTAVTTNNYLDPHPQLTRHVSDCCSSRHAVPAACQGVCPRPFSCRPSQPHPWPDRGALAALRRRCSGQCHALARDCGEHPAPHDAIQALLVPWPSTAAAQRPARNSNPRRLHFFQSNPLCVHLVQIALAPAVPQPPSIVVVPERAHTHFCEPRRPAARGAHLPPCPGSRVLCKTGDTR
jgi:hypothetical protein